MRAVILGTVVSNGGDAAILDAQVAALREALPGVQVAVHDESPTVARRLYPGLEIHEPVLAALARRSLPGRLRRLGPLLARADRRRLLLVARLLGRAPRLLGLAGHLLRRRERAVVLSLARAEVVCYSGGTTLVEQYPLDPKLFGLEVAVALGRPLVLLPQSLGPFEDPTTRRRVRALVDRAALVLLRDERSRRHLADVGADASAVRVVPDIVFGLAGADGAQRLRGGTLPEAPRVVVSARDCRRFFPGDDAEGDQRRYEDALGQLVEHVVRDLGGSVTFLSTCQGIPEYRHDDSAVAVRVAGRLPADVGAQVEVDRDHHDFAGLARAYAGFDLAVTTRMHAAIIALGAGVPVLPLAYEFKTHEVMGQLGLGDHVVDVAGLTGEHLVRRWTALGAALPALRPVLARRAQTMQAELGAVVDGLRSVVERP